MTDRTTPKRLGYRMPPEWGAHERTWMMWPCREEVWSDIGETRRGYSAVAHAVRRFEPLTMLVRPEDEAGARAMLGADIDLLVHPIDDSWCRDAGPCFVVDDAKKRKAGVSFRFNAWGGKYEPFDGDDSAAPAILQAAGVPCFQSGLIAEGGGITVDGEGTILTTESCFPNPNRNPDWTRAAIEAELMEMLGGDKVIWLPGDEMETETDGHVDGIAMFVAPGVVVMETAGGADHPYAGVMEDNIAALRGQADARGRPITIHTMPDAIAATADGDRFCRSYVNSYLVNGGVIMPAYGIAQDAEVREIWRGLFPDREVVMVDIAAIAIGGGGIHCITQQEPGIAP